MTSHTSSKILKFLKIFSSEMLSCGLFAEEGVDPLFVRMSGILFLTPLMAWIKFCMFSLIIVGHICRFCKCAYKMSTCGINWLKNYRNITNNLSLKNQSSQFALRTDTSSPFQVRVIFLKQSIKLFLCSNIVETIFVLKVPSRLH